MAQLEDNIGALELQLSPEQMAELDKVSAPRLNFPADFIKNAGPFMAAETTINGTTSGVSPLAPKSDSERHLGKAAVVR